MPTLRHLLITCTLFAVFAFTFASGTVIQVRKHHAPTDDEVQFQKLLATISDPELHDALEEYLLNKYHPDARGEDKTWMQILHHDNAAPAPNLIELVKRQNSNGTMTTSNTEPPTSTSPPATTPPTSTNNPPPTSGSSDTTPSESSTQAPPPTTSAPTSASSTNPPTSTPGGNSESSSTHRRVTSSSTTTKVVYTTTESDGGVSTVTTYTVVPASEPTGNPEPSETPTLQDAATRFEGIGFIRYAFILLIGLVALL